MIVDAGRDTGSGGEAAANPAQKGPVTAVHNEAQHVTTSGAVAAIAVDAKHIYVASRSSGAVLGGLLRIARADGKKDVLVPSIDTSNDVRISAGEVLFTTRRANSRDDVARWANGAAVIIARDELAPVGPIRDGDRYFWSTAADEDAVLDDSESEAHVRWVGVGGGPVHTVAGLTKVASFVVSGNTVYAVDTMRGHVLAASLVAGPLKVVRTTGNLTDLAVGPRGELFGRRGRPRTRPLISYRSAVA